MEPEQRPNKTIAIVVEGGLVQAVYAGAAVADADVELLDVDNAKVASDAEERGYVLGRIKEVEQTCTKIY